MIKPPFATSETSTPFSKKQIYNFALELRRQNRLYDLNNTDLEDTFRGSIDRFCTIAERIGKKSNVLDVGAGQGMLLSLLVELGHECYAVDIADGRAKNPICFQKQIHFQACNVEVDKLPFEDDFFDAVVCCQVLEHFSHSHLPAMKEIKRVLKTGGLVEVDVPNVVCFRNRSRILRGKNITFDYEKHYLYAVEPIIYKGLSFYPDRHNREFTRKEVQILLEATGFTDIEVSFLKSRRHRKGMEKIRTLGTMIKDAVPSLRKSIIAFARKP